MERTCIVLDPNRRTLVKCWSERVIEQYVSAFLQVPFQSTDTGPDAEGQLKLLILALHVL